MTTTKIPQSTVEKVRTLVGGQWETPACPRFGEVYNPSIGLVIAQVPLCTATEVDRAVQAAAAALPGWAETPVVERARIFFRYRDLLDRHADEIAHLVTREHGKTLAESRALVQRGVEMVEFACGIPSPIMGQTLPNLALSRMATGTSSGNARNTK
jgi:malonate-semialdehyde dehydrogenase (acetylating)/methylmalonate-semialdehyde dehydrogenase